MNAMKNEIMNEIDREIIQDLHNIAKNSFLRTADETFQKSSRQPMARRAASPADVPSLDAAPYAFT